MTDTPDRCPAEHERDDPETPAVWRCDLPEGHDGSHRMSLGEYTYDEAVEWAPPTDEQIAAAASDAEPHGEPTRYEKRTAEAFHYWDS